MAHRKQKTIVYRYNGDPKSDEEELDEHGDCAVSAPSAFIMRHGKLWRTVSVKRGTASSSRIYIVRVSSKIRTFTDQQKSIRR
jgi:hypothetical protein